MSKRTGSFRKITQIDRRTGNKIEISGKTLKEEDPKYALIPKESEAKEHTVTIKYLKPFEGNLLWLLGDDKKTQRKRKQDGANALDIFPGHVWAYLKEDTGEEKCKELRKYMYLKFCPKNLITKPQNPNNMSESRLKFRQWSPKYQRFFYWGHRINGHGDAEAGKEWTSPKIEHEKGSILDVQFSEQFTGLHDKNGREIYEGDIGFWRYKNPIRGLWCKETGVVCFGKGQFYLKAPETKVLHSMVDNYDFEIIGNIHQNSELL